MMNQHICIDENNVYKKGKIQDIHKQTSQSYLLPWWLLFFILQIEQQCWFYSKIHRQIVITTRRVDLTELWEIPKPSVTFRYMRRNRNYIFNKSLDIQSNAQVWVGMLLNFIVAALQVIAVLYCSAVFQSATCCFYQKASGFS